MRFVDEVSIYVKAGDGGRGCLSFRREKYVPKGGPDGGDGGKGGDVILKGDRDLSSLLDFKFKRVFRAQNGAPGSGNNKKGRDGKDLTIKVPLGTQIFEEKEDGLIFIGEILDEGDTLIVAKGGKGGRGNARFATPVNQAPTIFEYGDKGEEKRLRLVLKLIADCGLVGLPNVGKSTIVSQLSRARPKIADYPFTTLSPNLGVLFSEDESMVVADIPGIIKGASKGKGLGLKFLRHIERTKCLVFVIDSSSEDPLNDYETLKEELKAYNPELLQKKRLVVLNKIDLISEERLKTLLNLFSGMRERAVAVSALLGRGIERLIGELRRLNEE